MDLFTRHRFLDKDGDELEKLQLREVTLPPQVLLELRPHGGQEVVGVHDGVDEGVEDAPKGLVAVRGPVHQVPAEYGHDCVMS